MPECLPKDPVLMAHNLGAECFRFGMPREPNPYIRRTQPDKAWAWDLGWRLGEYLEHCRDEELADIKALVRDYREPSFFESFGALASFHRPFGGLLGGGV